MSRTIRGPTAPSQAGPSLSDTLVDAPSPVGRGHGRSEVGVSADRGESLPAGTVLGGKYEVVRALAVGGMGTVYEARHRALARRFAVKVLSLESEKQADAVPRFKREAELASAIGHESIVDVVDIDRTEDGRWYIVMELLEGEELRTRMHRDKRLPLEDVVAIARQIGDALDAAHSRGIVHRDLKPENIFVLPRRDGRLGVKVLDFGISKVRDADQGLTRPGEVLGTPYYMAPEQARGDRAVDHRADLFAFGAVVYEAVTGIAPFEGPTPQAVLRSILVDQPAEPKEVVPALPEAVSRVIMKALAKDPIERYQSGGELAEALARATGDGGHPSIAPASVPSTGVLAPLQAPEAAAGPRGYRTVHLVVAFVVGVAVCAAVVLVLKLLA